MSKIYGSPLWLSGGGGMNDTLPPLLDNFKATRNEGNITLSASKMEESRAKDLAGAVWVYGEHIPQNVNDGTKIQLTRDEIVKPDSEPYLTLNDIPASDAKTETIVNLKESDGCYVITRISGKVEKQVSWEKTKNFHVRQFTYNSKKQYQTMLEGAVASAIYSEFPEEPTDYLNCAEIPNTTEYEIPEDGWFRIDAIAKSGDGRRELRFTTGTPIYEAAWYSSGGGTGGYSRSEVALFKGDKLSIQITDSDINITGNSILINVTSGKDGNPASQDKIGTGGAAGTASGGNKINQNGLKGSDGNRVFQPGIGGKVDGGKGANQGEIQINNQKSYAIFGGNSASATKFTSSGMTEVAETSGNIAKVFISRGNTNIPSPSKASTLSLIPKNNSVEATWENSGDPVQTGTMLVYNTSHTPKSPSDGVAVDIPLTQPVTLALNSDSEELQEDSKKQSYTITGVPNDKPVFVALFPYDKDRKYGLAKQEVEIPREHSWYDKQQELEA